MSKWSNHPIFVEMLSHGYPEGHVSIAFQLYRDLIDAFHYWDVEYKHNKAHTKLYITAKKTSNSVAEAFWPVTLNAKLSVDELQTLQMELSQYRLNIAVMAKDTTTVIYQIQEGLVTPKTPLESVMRKIRSKKKKMIKKIAQRRNNYPPGEPK